MSAATGFITVHQNTCRSLLSVAAGAVTRRLYIQLHQPSHTRWTVSTIERALGWCYHATMNDSIDVCVIPPPSIPSIDYQPLMHIDDIDVLLTDASSHSEAEILLHQTNQQRESHGKSSIRLQSLDTTLTTTTSTTTSSSSSSINNNALDAALQAPSTPITTSMSEPLALLIEQQQSYMPSSFNAICVGGTFDRLHVGHKLLLSATALLASDYIEIGVSADKMLVNKQYRTLIEPLDYRMQQVRWFINTIKPNLDLFLFPLEDAYGYTLTNQRLTMLVHSLENANASSIINEKRIANGIHPVSAYVVSLVPGSEDGDKVSSTHLRARDAAKSGATES